MSDPAAAIPTITRGLLRAGLSREAADRALGDLADLYHATADVRGERAARLACVREGFFILLWAAVDRARGLLERRNSRPAQSRRTMILGDLGRDFRYGARALRRSPAFTAVALLTLALGIGANTAIFSVVERVLLHPVSWPDPERVVVIGWDWDGDTTWSLSSSKAQFWKENNRSFSAFAITNDTEFLLTGEGDPLYVSGELVSAGYFEVIGITAALGRTFTIDEYEASGGPVVILTDAFWRRSFGSDPGVVGRQIQLDRLAHTVIGVMPPGFRGAAHDGIEVLAPLRLVVDPRSQAHNYFAFGRLAPNVTSEQLAGEVAAFNGRYDDAFPGLVSARESFRFIAYNDFIVLMVGDFLRTAVWLLFGAVGAILLIACANVTNLLLARADSRRRELAVRSALGAGRARIVGQLVSESLLLTLIGGGLGLWLARLGLNAIVALAPAGVPRLAGVGLNLPVLGFALMVSVLTGLGVGIAGALPVLRTSVATTLKEGGRAQTTSAGRLHARGLLVATQAAFSVVLLVGAGLLLVSFFRLRAVDLGFEPEGVYTIELRLPPDRYATTEATWQFERQVLERLRALPGVSAAGSTANLPLVRGLNTGVTVASPGERRSDVRSVIEFRAVSADYLDVLGIRLLSGRGFHDADHAVAPAVALVNEAFVRRFLTEGEPIGATISMATSPAAPTLDGAERTVVGVVRDIKDVAVRRTARATVYAPRPQLGDGATRAMNEWFIAAFAIRAENVTSLAPALRRAVHEVDPELPIVGIRPMTDVVMASIAADRFNARLFATFACLALVLTAVGVYGVVSHAVGLRTHEIGLRMALGARRSAVIAWVVRRAMATVAIGVAIGLVAAFALSRLLGGILFGVRTADPATFSSVALLIGGVALLASYVPARRASRVDPNIALRSD